MRYLSWTPEIWTYGNYNIDYVHPVSRENNWKSKNLVMAGNFNLTNVGEVFQQPG